MTFSKRLFIILFCLQIKSCLSNFADDLKDTLANSLSYLQKGVNILQSVDEFIENTIGEDCEFQCKPGFEAVARHNHQPSGNGCGSLDVIFDDSEDSWIHVEEEFTKCCNTHDHCYDTCGADKDECDMKFKKCLYGTCKKQAYAFLDSKTCRLKAKLFYITVLGIGCQPYINAQKAACQCVKSEL